MKKPDLEKGKDQSKDKSLAQEEQGEKKQGKGKKNDKVNGEDNGLVKKTRTRSPGKGMGV